MAFSGGVFSRLYDWTTDRDNGVKILASRMDQEFDGMATGLSTCILKDGTQTCTAAVPFAEGLTIPDDKTLVFGTDSDVTIQYDETTNNALEIAANVEGAALGVVLKADQGDDNADQWKVNVADGGTLSINSKISGSFVSQLTLTPNATAASSTTAIAGNITVGGTVDGRDLATDGSKLDGIEASADVTDTANVTAAGALMDSEVTNLAQVKSFDSADYATAAQGSTADSALQNVSEDTTPQLGGNLDTNGNDINFGDNDKAVFGAGNDLQIYHDGNNSLINDLGTGDLRLRSNGSGVIVEMSNGNDLAQFLNSSGEAKLMHNGSEKLATTSTGIDVTGTVTAETSSTGEFNALTIHQATNTSGDEARIQFKRTTDGGSDREVAAIVADRVGGNDTALVFETNTDGSDGATERARIDQDGNLLVGTTTNLTGAQLSAGTTGIALRGDSDQIVVAKDGGISALFNRNTSDGGIITFQKGGSDVGSIGVAASDNLYIAGETGSTKGLYFNDGGVLPAATGGGTSDNAVDLGQSNVRFKDLYLSGGVYLGGTGAGNRLDQYEENTFTPSFSFTNGNGTLTTAAALGTYLRVGAFAFINGFISIGNKGTASGDCRISGIPFTPRNTSSLFQQINVGLNSTVSGQDFDGDFYYYGQLQANDATLRMYSHKGTGSIDQLNAVDVQNGTDFRFSGWFAIE